MWTVTSYDVLGRPLQVLTPDAGEVSTSYAGNRTTVTDQRNKSTIGVRNGLGEVVQTIDATGLVLENRFDAAGNIVQVRRDAGRGTILNEFAYDALGRKVAQNDPDSGYMTFEYNALGELIAQQDAGLQRTEQRYDARGRVWERTVRLDSGIIESQSVFEYDSAPGGVGQLASEMIGGAYSSWRGQTDKFLDMSRVYVYDGLGRPQSMITTIDGVSYSSQTVYDTKGRPFLAQDASGQWVKHEYSSRGALRATCHYESNAVPACSSASQYARTLETDAWGNVVHEERGANGQMTIAREHDPLTGRVLRICADKSGGPDCELVDEAYGWDKSGNLHTQQKGGRYVEGFVYDDLHRLSNSYFLQIGATSYAPYEKTGHWAVYDAVGNVCARTIDGTGQTIDYAGRAGCGASTTHGSGTSSTVGAHRVSSVGTTSYAYDSRGNQTVRNAAGTAQDRTIRYSADNKAYAIMRGTTSAPLQTLRFWYGPDGQRYKREDVGGKRTLYLGNVEIVTQGAVTTVKRHIAGAVLQTIVGTSTTSRYLFHDQLGSVARITDAAGVVQASLDYIPAGARRSMSDPMQVEEDSPALSDRGFTGHEHLDGVGVIHMNGRIYDPGLGRFLQPDPFVQAPGSAQSWNAYTYVFNNPLRYTDPTGMLGQSERGWLGAIIMLAAAVTQQYWAAGFTGTYGAAMTAGVYAGVGFVSGAVATQSWRGGLMGAMTALITAGVRIATVDGGVAGWGVQTFTGGVTESLRGGNFGHAFASAGLSAAFTPDRGQIPNPVARTMTGAIVGGTISRATGGKFANGAVMGAIQAAMAGGKRTLRRASAAGGVATVITPEAQREFNRIADGFSGRTFLFSGGAEMAFFDAFFPFTEKYGLEVGANIIKWGRYSVADITRGTATGVHVPVNQLTVLEVHTHPIGAASGFSGYLRSVSGEISASRGEDYAMTWEHAQYSAVLRGAMVGRAGDRAVWQFDYLQFREAHFEGGGAFIDAEHFTWRKR